VSSPSLSPISWIFVLNWPHSQSAPCYQHLRFFSFESLLWLDAITFNRTEICAFSGYKIYPGKGRVYIRSDNRWASCHYVYQWKWPSWEPICTNVWFLFLQSMYILLCFAFLFIVNQPSELQAMHMYTLVNTIHQQGSSFTSTCTWTRSANRTPAPHC
jgi:hypothetical protein